MIHVCLLKLGLTVAYYIGTLAYPLAETYKAMEKKTMDDMWKKMLTYWVIYILLGFLDCILFFVSG